MKRRFVCLFSLIVVLFVCSTLLSGCNSSKSNSSSVKTVKLNEVVRSIFYAPMYVAINNGYFTKQGINIDLSTGQGADKTMQEVLSKNVDIGFCGPEQSIYIQNQNKEDYPIVFADLTQRDGSFLVGRKEEKNFNWKSLKGKTIIGARPGGVPEMTLEYVLKKYGLNPKKDVNIITNIDFSATAGAFKAGTADYVALFEPTASILEKDGSGYIESSIGGEAGPIAYTCFFTRKSYLDANKDTLIKFTKAIYEGQTWVQNNSDEKVAEKIKSFFPGTDVKLLAKNVKNYREANAFAKDPTVHKENIEKLMNIIEGYKSDLIKTRPAFTKLVNTDIAKKAMK
ncbi:MAG: ABC transporter substrate-binding protein [Clostridium sp.]|nr:ABC transporter substrate-binding protein [Clostridium sp.]